MTYSSSFDITPTNKSSSYSVFFFFQRGDGDPGTETMQISKDWYDSTQLIESWQKKLRLLCRLSIQMDSGPI